MIVYIDISKNIFVSSREYSKKYGLEPQDALIYASIINDMENRSKETTKCFLSRDKKAFDSSSMKDELSDYSCRYFTRFEQCLGYVKANINR